MNPRAFEGLTKLKDVQLHNNVCIQDSFEGFSRIADLLRHLPENCGFVETKIPQSSDIEEKNRICELSLATAGIKLKRVETELTAAKSAKFYAENQQQICQSSLSRKTTEKVTNEQLLNQTKSLHNELVATKSAKAQCESQIAFIRELTDKLDAQRNEIFIAKTEELRRTVESKLLENDELSSELQKKNIELNEKNQKIKQLEEKIEILNASNRW